MGCLLRRQAAKRSDGGGGGGCCGPFARQEKLEQLTVKPFVEVHRVDVKTFSRVWDFELLVHY
jgi:hypothetical protein